MAQSGGVHRGAFLCMNVSGSTDPTAKDPTRAQAHEAVLAAFKEAERSGARPSAILLQEYSWATNGRPGLRGLLDSLGESWKPVRQLEDAGVKDTAVLYDSAIYDGSGLVAGSDQPMACSPGNNMEFHVEFPARERQAILSYQGRWSGVHLGAIDPATGKPSLQFLLVSYHGRSNKRQTRNLVAGGKPKLERLPPKYKKALAQDFVAEVAKAALRSQVGFGVTQYTARSVPAVVAGDWNRDAESFENFTGLAHGTDAWACSHHLPTRPPGGGVRVSKEDLDYVVAINGDRRHEHSCELRIEAVQGLPHLAKHRTLGLFDHDPVLTTFTVLAVPVAATEQMGHGMRVAAEQAKIKILEAITGRPTGKQLQDQAVAQPPPSFKFQPTPDSSPAKEPASSSSRGGRGGGRKPGSIATAEPSHVEDSAAVAEPEPEPEPAEPAAVVFFTAEAPVEAAPKPVPPQTAAEEGTPITLARSARYDLSKSEDAYKKTKLKVAVKAMALDALGVHGQYLSKERCAEGAARPWWPAGVTSAAEFDKLPEEQHRQLYTALRQVLLPSQGNVLPAGGLRKMVDNMRKSLTTGSGRQGAREP